MTPELQKQLSTAIECLPNSAARDDFIRTLRDHFPQETATIDAYLACEQSGDPRKCLNRAAYGRRPPRGADAFLPLSTSAHAMCGTIASEGDAQQVPASFVPFAHGVGTTIMGADYQGLPTDERATLDGLWHFYANRLGSPLPALRAAIRSRPAWVPRVDRYSSTLPTATLSPRLCPNDADFERHDIAVEGFPFQIPVFRPRTSTYPWEFVESDLIGVFEILKVFLSPSDIRRMFTPPDKTALALFVTDPLTQTEFERRRRTSAADAMRFDIAPLRTCGIDTQLGQGLYVPWHNYIWISSYEGGGGRGFSNVQSVELGPNVVPLDHRNSLTTSSLFWDYLIHELTHSLAYNAVGTGYSSSTWNNVILFYEWSKRRHQEEPSRASLVPNYTGVATMDIGRLTYILSDYRRYAETNVQEFFAELVTEHVLAELGTLRPDSPEYRARRRIMQSFFGESGINSSAFDPTNIESAFRAEGITMTLIPPTPASPPRVPTPPRSSMGADLRASGTITGGGYPGGQFYLGVGSVSENSIGFGAGMLLGLQGSSVPRSSSPQVLMGGELSLRTPMAPVRLELYGRGGIVLDSNPNAYAHGFSEFGLRLPIYPSPRSSSGFHIIVGGSFFLDFGDLSRSTPRFELGLGFSFH